MLVIGGYMRNFEFGEKLYRYRKLAKLSQQELASNFGITNKAISKWENGEAYPSLPQLVKLAKLYGVSLDELVNKSNNQQKQTYKIAITGGPCSGKSTALSWLQSDFRKKGFMVMFVPETATELILGGISYDTIDDNYNFEKSIIKLQIEKEKVFEEAAKHIVGYDKVLIICDRGVMDCKAYTTDLEFKRILKELNTNEIALRDSYDAVFHLVTAAKGAAEFYNLQNAARRESLEEAIDADDRTLNSWIGHPHLRVIDNSTDFERKMRRLVGEITEFVGTDKPYEIERKFLIEYPNLEKLEKLPNCSKVEIIQTYLKSDKDTETRVRQRGQNGYYTYTKTIKTKVSDMKRIELESRISQEEYLNCLLEADLSIGQIRKTRYCLTHKNKYLEIDVYPFWQDKAILEIELNNEKEKFEFPKFINPIKEVTGNKDYFNSTLAKLSKQYLNS